MAKFLNSSAITHYLENLIRGSDDKLFLISPYLKFNPRIKQLLDDRNCLRTVDIKVIYGKTDLHKEESDWLKSMDSIKVLFCKSLHAKCYMNEKCAIVTSMNLYDFSQQNNNEMGIYITKEEDSELYRDIVEEVNTLIRTSEQAPSFVEKVILENTPTKKAFLKTRYTKTKVNTKGHCIRCDAEIKFDTDIPLCKKCYQNWKIYSDETYEEKFCHKCGKKTKSSMDAPQCYSCFKKK